MVKVVSDFEILKGMTKYIQNPVLKYFVNNFLEDLVPPYFQEVPASSSGKYHPAYCLGDGGLVRHTIATVKLAMHICNLDQTKKDLMNLPGGLTSSIDRIIAACILHDTFKQGNGITRHSVKDHEIIAANEIRKADPRAEAVAALVESHMGQWGVVKPTSVEQRIVHLADYLASRKDINIDTDFPTEFR